MKKAKCSGVDNLSTSATTQLNYAGRHFFWLTLEALVFIIFMALAVKLALVGYNLMPFIVLFLMLFMVIGCEYYRTSIFLRKPIDIY